MPGRLATDGAAGLGAWQQRETCTFCYLFCEEEPLLHSGQKRGLAITLARAIIASPHSHEDESS